MSRGKKGVFASVAAVALLFGSTAVSADDHTIGAVDNIAPEVPGNFAAEIDLGGPTVTLTWDLSASDNPSVTGTGNHADAGGTNFVASNDVTGYTITRTAAGEETVVYSLAPGVSEYVDTDDLIASAYEYVLTVSDGTHEVSTEAVEALLGAPPVSSIDPLAIDFGTIEVGADVSSEEVSSDVIISNAEGAGDLVFSLSPVGPGFSASARNDDGWSSGCVTGVTTCTVAAGESLTIVIAFNPDVVDNVNGDYSGSVTISTNDPENREYDIPVSATITGGAQLDVVGDGLTFVNVPLGESRTQTLTVQNVGGFDLVADLILTNGDTDVFVFLETVNVTANSSVDVDVTFTPDATDGAYTGSITITSEQDPAATFERTLDGAEGTVEPNNPVEEEVVEVVITLSETVSAEVFVEGTPENEKFKEDVRAALATALGIPADRIIITGIIQSSTEVTFQIIEPPDDEPEAPSAAAVAATLETIVADEPETLVDALETETGEELGTVDEVTTEAVVVVIQPIDAEGNAVAGWFTRTGTKVDFDDFFAFADAFGSGLGDPSFDSVFDISGADLTPDGQVNFDDFFKFADDFGKTVSNAAEVQAILGL